MVITLERTSLVVFLTQKETSTIRSSTTIEDLNTITKFLMRAMQVTMITSSFGYPGAAITKLGIVVDPRCPEANVGSSRDNESNTSSTFPNSYYWAGPGLYTGLGRCGYDFAQDIMSIPRAKRNAFLMKSSYDLSPDVTMNTVVMFSQLEGDSRFAGTPITAPF